MLGKRGTFGKRSTPLAPLATVRQAGATPAGAPVGHRVFSNEVFEGETGEFLRKMGFDPDQMGNIVGSSAEVGALLADDDRRLREALAAVNSATPHEIAPRYLLSLEAWDGPLRDFLVKQLDLSPFRPWNVALLPVTAAGAKALGLPTTAEARVDAEKRALAISIVEEIQRIFGGATDGPAQATDYMLSAIRDNYPDLFPTDSSQFSERVRRARANVRALAVSLSGVPTDAIRRCHKMYLAQPAVQLIA